MRFGYAFKSLGTPLFGVPQCKSAVPVSQSALLVHSLVESFGGVVLGLAQRLYAAKLAPSCILLVLVEECVGYVECAAL